MKFVTVTILIGFGVALTVIADILLKKAAVLIGDISSLGFLCTD
jgi:hypothetical protein